MADFSQGRTQSLSELTELEAQALKLYLVPIVTSDQNAKAAALDRQRKKVISHLKGAGFTLPDGRADMSRIYNWVETTFKVHLNSMDRAQLSKVIVAAENVETSTLKAIYHATRSN